MFGLEYTDLTLVNQIDFCVGQWDLAIKMFWILVFAFLDNVKQIQ